ncbi:MAG: DUF4810 domain-containing protein [Burkholderiaceae bacterium]|nr:DUF4810 domain-containing protein [Burkholderiaceae bacterium]
MRARRPRVVAVALLVAGLAGCAQTSQPLYLWEGFPRQQYAYLLREGISPEQQIQEIEAHAGKARAANAQLPPGLRAHLGLLYLSVGNPGRAMELWNAEQTAFPESAVYMGQLLKRLAGPDAAPARPDAQGKQPPA